MKSSAHILVTTFLCSWLLLCTQNVSAFNAKLKFSSLPSVASVLVSKKKSNVKIPQRFRPTTLHSATNNVPLETLKLHPTIERGIEALQSTFQTIDRRTLQHMNNIIKYYGEEQVDSQSFHGVNGYGHGDIGREKYDNVIAKLCGAEMAYVRLQFFSGTHAISTALFASLRPGDQILCVSGKPYDTLEEVIGLRENEQTGNLQGSLKDWGIGYKEIELLYEEKSGSGNDPSWNVAKFDIERIKKELDENVSITLLHIQRSCGYQWRPSISIDEIKTLTDFIKVNYKQKGRDIVVFVDNCYGELVEDREPTHVGVDLMAGSLIKNFGGTLAPSGAYVVGRKDLVNRARVHLSAPGVDGGATFNQYLNLFQGLFMAPSVVAESLKGAHLLSYVMEKELGYECNPHFGSSHHDIVQAVKLNSREKLIAFCEAVQRKSPVGGYIRPCPGMSPGYGTEVIFADGTFIDGSTLELSADGPLREPFVAFSQGCTHWTHWVIVLNELLKSKAFKQQQI